MTWKVLLCVVAGHQWRWISGSKEDICVRCEEAVRPHQILTTEYRPGIGDPKP